MTNRFHSLVLMLVSCATVSLQAMDGKQTYQPITGTEKSVQMVPAFNPHFNPAEVVITSNFQPAVSQTILQAAMELQVAQVRVLGEKEISYGQPCVELRPLENQFIQILTPLLTDELTKDFKAQETVLIANTKKEEAAKLSIFQRNPKKTILCALTLGAVLPFVLPEVLKKSGL